MRIVIIGCGKVGVSLARSLSREGHDLTVIDRNRTVLEQNEERLDMMILEGNGTSVSLQKQAEVSSADLLIAVTGYDEVNLLCCMIAKKLGCDHTIARIRNPEYIEAYNLLREDFGLSMAVNPERTAAREIYGLLRYPSLLKRLVFSKGRAEIVELPVRAGGKLDGMQLMDLYHDLKVRTLVCAVDRNGEVTIPGGSFTLMANDRIYVTAPSEALLTLIRFTGLETFKVRSVMILGGSRIAFYLTQTLIKNGIDVKILDSDKDQCERLSEALPEATIVYADATSIEELKSEGLEETDALISLMNVDEQNIVVSMLANEMNVPRVITKINRTEYSDILDRAGIECVVTPRDLSSMEVLRFVRAMESPNGDDVLALTRIADGKAEALEFVVDKTTWHCGVPLQKVPLKKELLIAAITHNNNVIIPSGESVFQPGDTMVIVTRADRTILKINDIFSRDARG